MVKHKGKVDPTLKGKHGRTALHIAAILDHAECVKILVSFLTVTLNEKNFIFFFFLIFS